MCVHILCPGMVVFAVRGGLRLFCNGGGKEMTVMQ